MRRRIRPGSGDMDAYSSAPGDKYGDRRDSMITISLRMDKKRLAALVLALALRSYVDGLACRRVLAIMAQREGHGDLLDKGRKK